MRYVFSGWGMSALAHTAFVFRIGVCGYKYGWEISYPRQAWLLLNPVYTRKRSWSSCEALRALWEHTSCTFRTGLITVYIANIYECSKCAPRMLSRINGILGYSFGHITPVLQYSA